MTASDFEHGDSLGACMRRVYRELRSARPRLRDLPLSPRDWPSSSRAFVAALTRINAPVWFVDRDPDDPDEARHVIARLDPASGSVRFLLTTPGQLTRLAPADAFSLEGRQQAPTSPDVTEQVARG